MPKCAQKRIVLPAASLSRRLTLNGVAARERDEATVADGLSVFGFGFDLV